MWALHKFRLAEDTITGILKENVTTFREYNSVHLSLSKVIIPLKGEVMQEKSLTFFRDTLNPQKEMSF